MKSRIDSLLKKEDNTDQLRYIMYSGHDYQISNILVFLNTSYLGLHEIPYDSSIQYELHYNQTCLDTVNDLSCFYVETYYNREPLKFNLCQ